MGVHDRGFLFADAVGVDLRAFGGRVFDRSAHLDALRSAGDRLGIDVPGDLADRVRETLTENDLADARLRVTATRGTSEGADPTPVKAGDPTVVVTAYPMPRGGLEGTRPFDGPAALQTAKVRRAADPGTTAARLDAVRARRELHEGADEAVVRHSDGGVVGGADSNLLVVAGDGLRVPDAGPVFPGVVRDRVVEYAREADVPVRETRVEPADVREAEEVVLTSTVWGVRPVGTVDGIDVGGGPLTDLVRRQYREHVEDEYY